MQISISVGGILDIYLYNATSRLFRFAPHFRALFFSRAAVSETDIV